MAWELVEKQAILEMVLDSSRLRFWMLASLRRVGVLIPLADGTTDALSAQRTLICRLRSSTNPKLHRQKTQHKSPTRGIRLGRGLFDNADKVKPVDRSA